MAIETNSPLTPSMEKELASDEVFISTCDERVENLLCIIDQVWEEVMQAE